MKRWIAAGMLLLMACYFIVAMSGNLFFADFETPYRRLYIARAYRFLFGAIACLALAIVTASSKLSDACLKFIRRKINKK